MNDSTQTEQTEPPVSDSLRGDLLQMIALRSELAQLDAAVAKRKAIGLGITMAVGLLLLLVGLGPCVTVVGEQIAQRLQVSRSWTLLALGGGMVTLGSLALLTAFLGVRRLQLFQASMDELREDLAWLQEWRGGASA